MNSDETSQSRAWRYHFSVDDVFESLLEVADSGRGLFENDFFAFLLSLNDRFDVHIDLNVFAEGEVGGRQRSLIEVPERLRQEFESAPWLQLGPHAQCYQVKPFDQTLEQQVAMFQGLYEQIDRFAGRTARCRWLRLHYFSECYEAAPYLLEQGVESLLLTDKPAVAYRLDDSRRAELKGTGQLLHHGLELRRSFCRIETMVAEGWDDLKLTEAFRDRLENHGYLALFSHEIEFQHEDVKAMTIRCLEILQRLEIPEIPGVPGVSK